MQADNGFNKAMGIRKYFTVARVNWFKVLLANGTQIIKLTWPKTTEYFHNAKLSKFSNKKGSLHKSGSARPTLTSVTTCHFLTVNKN